MACARRGIEFGSGYGDGMDCSGGYSAGGLDFVGYYGGGRYNGDHVCGIVLVVVAIASNPGQRSSLLYHHQPILNGQNKRLSRERAGLRSSHVRQ